MKFEEKLEQSKESYPFNKWRKGFDFGMVQYTDENCTKAKTIFDELIVALISLGGGALEKDKVNKFEIAVVALNNLNEECDDCLIETGEREELCELVNKISIAAGIEPGKYGCGEGLASEWRDW